LPVSISSDSPEGATNVRVPELDTAVFILPEWLTKNGEKRIVVMNGTTHYSAPGTCQGHPVRAAGVRGAAEHGFAPRKSRKIRSSFGAL
jgi:hypothetical protein